MGDKDHTQREVSNKVCKNVKVNIYRFHIIQAFKRDLRNIDYNMTGSEKEQTTAYLKRLVYNKTKNQYDKIHDKLFNELSELFLKYFNDNWHDIRYEWT